MLLPEQYTRPLVTPSGNEVWGIYAKAHRPEAPHAHQGGVLFARTQPLKVFSHPDRTLLYTTDKVDKMVRPILLPPAGMHYAVYEQDYQGVFIHIKSRNDRPESEWGRRPLKIEKENGCEKISLAKETLLATRGKDVFLMSEKALKVIDCRNVAIPKLPQLPYCVYSLRAQDPQTYTICSALPFYLVEV